MRQKVRIRGCVTDHSEEGGMEINMKSVYLLRMIEKIESIKGWYEIIAEHNSKGQIEIAEYELVVSQVYALFYLAFISTIWLGRKVDGGNDSELKIGRSHMA